MELVGPKVILKINPYSDVDKFLKFLRDVSGKISEMAVLEGDIHPLACGYTSDGNFYVCPYNGPKLIEGERLHSHPNYIVNKIYYIEEQSKYIINLIRNDIFSNPSDGAF